MALIGTGEIQREYGLSRTQVFRLIASGEWPDAHTTLEGGTRLWNERTVRAQMAKLERSGRVMRRDDSTTLVPRRYLARKPVKPAVAASAPS